MLNTKLLNAAFIVANELHSTQVRKASVVSGIPYMSHLMEVAGMVMTAGGDEVTVAAALLHDAIEDVKVDVRPIILRELGSDGDAVLALVESVTEPGPTGDVKAPWRERKEAYLAHVSQASYESLLISVADKLQSDRDLLRQFLLGASWATLNSKVEGADQIWFRRGLVAAYRIRLDSISLEESRRCALHALINEFDDVVEKLASSK